MQDIQSHDEPLSMSKPFDKKRPATLCWDCAKATGGCSWSNRLRPVEGWKIVSTKHKTYDGDFISCIVLRCPLFERDAIGGGLKWIKGTIYEKYKEEGEQ